MPPTRPPSSPSAPVRCSSPATGPRYSGACLNRPISIHRLGEMPIQSCGQSVSAPRRKAGARLIAHTDLRAKRQRSAREARPIETNVRKRFITFYIQQRKPSAVNPGSTWGQPGDNLGSTLGQPGVNLGSSRGQPGVNLLHPTRK